MAQPFKEHTDNAYAQIASSGGLNNTTTPITLSLASGKGALFATITNGQYVTIWDAVTYPNPGDDPNEEIATITARTGDSITLARPNAVAHAGTPYVAELVRSSHFTDIEKGMPYDAVVDASGKGNYTTLSAALTAGARSIYIRRGSYSETTALSTAWTGTSAINIVGEDRGGVVLTLNANAAGYLNINISRSRLENLTITIPSTALGAATTGWVTLTSTTTDCVIRNVTFNGANANVVGAVVSMAGAANTIEQCKFSGGAPNSGSIYVNAATDSNIVRCTVSEIRAAPCINLIGGSDRCKVNQCEFSNSGQQLVVQMSGANGFLTDSRISTTGSSVTNGSDTIVLASGTAGGTVIANNFISKNPQSNANGNAIFDNGNSHIRIIGNFIDLSSVGTAGSVMAINFQNSAYSVVNGNVIRGSSSAYRGIYLGSTGWNVASGNVIRDFTQNDGGLPRYGCAILIANGGNGNQVIGNVIVNCTSGIEDNDGGHRIEDSSGQLKAINASTSTTTLDFIQYAGYRIAISANTTLVFTQSPLPSRIPAGTTRWLHIKQDATGSRTITWPADVLWAGGAAPTLTTTGNKTDIIRLRWDRTEQKWMGSVEGLNY